MLIYGKSVMDVDMEQTRLAWQTHAFSGRQLQDFPGLVEALLRVKQALAWVNCQLGLIQEAEYQAIFQAGDELMADRSWAVADPYQGGGGIAVHMNLNEAFAARLGGEAWLALVSRSQSTTDVCTTALNLALTVEARRSADLLQTLVDCFKVLADRYQTQTTQGRTCLRDAGELSYGDRFRGFAQLISRYQTALSRRAAVVYSNLGGTALGTGEGINPLLIEDYRLLANQQLSALSGIEIQAYPDLIDSVQNKDDLLSWAQGLEGLALALLKIAKDLRLLASGPRHGFNEIELPALIKGSSFYRGKINPTLEETVMQMAFSVLGLMHSAKMGQAHAELDMDVYYLYSGCCLLEAFELMAQLLPKYCQYNLTHLSVKQRKNNDESVY